MKVSNFKTFKDFVNENNEAEEVNKEVEENEVVNLDSEEKLDETSEDGTSDETLLDEVGEITEDVDSEDSEESDDDNEDEDDDDDDNESEDDDTLDIRTDIESDGELDGNTIPENSEDELPVMDVPEIAPIGDYDAYMPDIDYSEVPTPEIENEGGCKIVIINGCEPETEVDSKTDELKEKLGCECEEIYLYQLNIQSPKKNEPRDGMEMIYGKIEEADAVIFACESKKGSLSEELKNVIDRLKAHYTESELRNKVFGSIIIGKEDSKLKDELVLCAINDLHMVVGGDCVYVGTGESADLSTMAICMTNLCNATIGIRGSVNTPNENVDSEIDTYGEFVDREQSEDPTDLGLPNDLPEEGTEENDTFVDELKGNLEDAFNSDIETEEEELDAVGEGDADIDNDGDTDDSDAYLHRRRDAIKKSIEEEKEDKTEEEEERLIDNLDGTITHIHKGWEDTNKKKGDVKDMKEGLNIKPFDEFL